MSKCKYLVTMHCGQQRLVASPSQRFCNPQCNGFHSRNPESKRWQPKRQRRVMPYLPSAGPLWEGATQRVTRDGYVQMSVYDPKTGITYRRMEHIIVWERFHGRRVPRGHVIHHANEDRLDNRISNLIALPNAVHVEMHGVSLVMQ